MVFALLDNVRMRPKLLALFLFTATIPLLLVGGAGCYFAIQTLSRQTATNLTSLQDMQADKLSWAFRQLHALLQAQAANPHIRQALTKEAPESIRPHLATTARTFGLYGLALVTQTGLIHASTIPDIEGKSLTFGELAASPLSTAWSQSREATAPVFVDFTRAPLGGTLPLAFMALPVGGADGIRLGVLVAPDFVNQALSSRLGLGKTGETYAIRHLPEGGDRYEFRSSLQTMGAGAFTPGAPLARPPAYWRDAVEHGDHHHRRLAAPADSAQPPLQCLQIHRQRHRNPWSAHRISRRAPPRAASPAHARHHRDRHGHRHPRRQTRDHL